ncbi:hypothetical protein ABIC03_001603 [Bradyrhizobium sp. RT6a]
MDDRTSAFRLSRMNARVMTGHPAGVVGRDGASECRGGTWTVDIL